MNPGRTARWSVAFGQQTLEEATVGPAALVLLTTWVLAGLALGSLLRGLLVPLGLAGVGGIVATAVLKIVHPRLVVVQGDGSVDVTTARGRQRRLDGTQGRVEQGRWGWLRLVDGSGATVRVWGAVMDTVGMRPLLAERGWEVTDQPTVTRGTTPPPEVVWEPGELPRPRWFSVLRAVSLPTSGAAVGLLIGGPRPLGVLLGAVVITALAGAEGWWRRTEQHRDPTRITVHDGRVELVSGDGGGALLPDGGIDALVIVTSLGAPVAELDVISGGRAVALLRLPHDEAFAVPDVLACLGQGAPVTIEPATPMTDAVDAIVERLST